MLSYTVARSKFFQTLAVIDPKNTNDGGGKKTKKKRQKPSSHRKQGGAASYKFVDKAKIRVSAGTGGKGCISFEAQLGSSYKKKPNGGHGGNGGNVIIIADSSEQSLNMQTHHHKGENGKNGSSKQMHGRNGKDKIVRVPCGVVVKRILEYDEVLDPKEQIVRKRDSTDDDMYEHDGEDQVENISDEFRENIGLDRNRPSDFDDIVNQGIKSQDDGFYYWESEKETDDDELVSSSDMIYSGERESILVGDLDAPGSYIVVAEGGRGGVGNCFLAKHQYYRRNEANTLERAQGKPGHTRHLELELKLIADIGLVGFPNAGKSSLLAAMSKAQPEIAPYPFTTLHPLVGSLEYRDGFKAIIADVPGLIDGAAEGKGRGHDFLRHLERTKGLMYIVDAAGVDGRNPLSDLDILVDEIESYGAGDTMDRPALVVANKLDLIKDLDVQDEILYRLSEAAIGKGVRFNGEVHGISAGVTGEGLGDLSIAIRSLVEKGEEKRKERNNTFGYL